MLGIVRWIGRLTDDPVKYLKVTRFGCHDIKTKRIYIKQFQCFNYFNIII